MALTITLDAQPNGRAVAGAKAIRRGTITFDSSYATGGEAVTAASMELTSIDDLRVDSSAGYVFEWDKTNAKIKAYRQKDPAAAGGADIALPEVANAIDLSLVIPRFRAEGV